MIVKIRHQTRYVYASPARYTVQSLRLTPRSFVGQRVLEWSIDAPGIGGALRFQDAFGNEVHQASIVGPHKEVVVTAGGTVETSDQAGIVRGLSDVVPLRVFLRHTPLTAAGEGIRELVAGLKTSATLDGLHALASRIREVVEYESGITDSRTPAEEALTTGRGVCQDHTHIFLAAARHAGIPARYITGYLVVDSSEAQAQHAWAEAWVPDLGWVGFDVANRVCPTDRYIRLAAGYDAPHASPIRGCRRGGELETLDVSLEVQQQGGQQ